jgi:uncharacterized protein
MTLYDSDLQIICPGSAGAAPSSALDLKQKTLGELLRPKLSEGLIVAFSGGVDSAFLVWSAEHERKRSGGRLLALTTESASLSSAEHGDVVKFIEEHKIPHAWAESRELLDPRYLVNDASRCFYCKTELFRICHEVAAQHGYRWVAYGYNASYRGDVRPGHQAAIDNGILSPLADAQLTKSDIRELMRREGLKLADKPASPCLSSRLMTGVQITSKKLREIDELEQMLRGSGLEVFRVRVHETGGSRFLRLEVAPDEMPLAFDLRASFTAEAKRLGFSWVTLDLDGYKMGGGNLVSK